MTDQDAEHDETGRPWWHAGSDAMPDVEALLGPEGMAAVGSAADEALKLFVVLRDRVVDAAGRQPAAQGSAQTDAQPEAGVPWADLLGQLASGAVQAVQDVAGAASAGRPGPFASRSDDRPPAEDRAEGEEQSDGDGQFTVLPGQAAACSYCPVCQAIALFRSVPISTWQRLATSVVEVADAAREFSAAGTAQPQGPVRVTPEPNVDPEAPNVLVADLLASIVASVDDAQEPTQ